jgi:hypothetical protein
MFALPSSWLLLYAAALLLLVLLRSFTSWLWCLIVITARSLGDWCLSGIVSVEVAAALDRTIDKFSPRLLAFLFCYSILLKWRMALSTSNLSQSFLNPFFLFHWIIVLVIQFFNIEWCIIGNLARRRLKVLSMKLGDSRWSSDWLSKFGYKKKQELVLFFFQYKLVQCSVRRETH